jgi:hypothetical protein
MFKRTKNNYKYIAINPMCEIGADMPIVPFIKLFATKEEEPIDVDMTNPESVAYMVCKAAYDNTGLFVHDINLPDKWAEKYEIGTLIKERGFVDMTNKIGQMTTSHRYAIISNHVANFSQFEDGTNWNLHTAAPNSKFKVLYFEKSNALPFAYQPEASSSNAFAPMIMPCEASSSWLPVPQARPQSFM